MRIEPGSRVGRHTKRIRLHLGTGERRELELVFTVGANIRISPGMMQLDTFLGESPPTRTITVVLEGMDSDPELAWDADPTLEITVEESRQSPRR